MKIETNFISKKYLESVLKSSILIGLSYLLIITLYFVGLLIFLGTISHNYGFEDNVVLITSIEKFLLISTTFPIHNLLLMCLLLFSLSILKSFRDGNFKIGFKQSCHMCSKYKYIDEMINNKELGKLIPNSIKNEGQYFVCQDCYNRIKKIK